LPAIPTKGNLIKSKNLLKFCKMGFDILDKKRNVLICEIMSMISKSKEIQSKIELTFSEAYSALRQANLDLGINTVEQISFAIPVENSVNVKFHSVMGVEIPIVSIETSMLSPHYGFLNTTSSLDEACLKFYKVKILGKELAQIENSIFRLSDNIKKTQKRANSLKNILIPKYENEVLAIQNAIEEKEREEFSRLKVIKKND
jgi:V/A-type H+-transporting ATPase subunit D